MFQSENNDGSPSLIRFSSRAFIEVARTYKAIYIHILHFSVLRALTTIALWYMAQINPALFCAILFADILPSDIVTISTG
jgi:hypothetical protein